MEPRDLDDLLGRARDAGPEASPALLARVLDDALRHQPAPAVPIRPRRRARVWARLWSGLAGALGGGVAVAGLGTATLAGLFLGFAQPAALTPAVLTDVLWQDTPLETVELIPSLDAFLTEG
ncbi:MAG TPA: dihydroorotate dehydrogenase [Paracoccaceae bacterium]